jgi:hypothetical protein
MQICRRIIPYLLAETTNCRGTLAFGSRRKVALEITAAGLTEAPHHHHSAQCPGALPIKTHKKIIFGCKRELIMKDDYFMASDLAAGHAAFSSAPAPSLMAPTPTPSDWDGSQQILLPFIGL